MKKHVLLSFFLCGTALTATAQGFYFKLGGSYALPLGSQSLMETVEFKSTVVNQNTVATASYGYVKGSYGAGINTSFSAGYKFTPFIGIDLNVSYLFGKQYEGNSIGTDGNTEISLDSLTKARGIFISPTVMFMVGGGKVRPYALVGVTTGTVTIEDTAEGLLSGLQDDDIAITLQQETKGEFAFGFRGGAGVDINIAPKFSIYVEAIFNAINYYAKETKTTLYEVNDVDQLPDRSIRDNNIVYVDVVTLTAIDGTEVIDENKPQEALRKPLPLSSLSFGFGVKYRLSID